MTPSLDFLDAAGSRLWRWTLAGTLVIATYASACVLALATWSDDEMIDETAGAFVVELASETMAPPAEMLDLAIGPPAEEVAAASAVAPTEAVQEQSQDESPDVAEAPLAPKPEVVVQKKQPVEKPDEKQVKDAPPRPEQVNLEQASAAPQKARAPPPVDAPPAKVAVAAKQGISSKPSEASLTWQKAVALHLNKHKTYPGRARDRGEEGVATVWISIDRSGKVIASQLVTTSGSQLLDKEAVDLVSRANPLPRPPSDIMDLAYDFTLPIRFRISK